MATLSSILSELRKKGTPQTQKNYARHRMARRIGEKRKSARSRRVLAAELRRMVHSRERL